MIDKQKLRISGITYGLLLGAVITILSVISYYIIVNTSSVVLVSALPFVFSVLLPIILVIVLCISFRGKVGGFWTMRQASSGIFIMFFTAFVIQFIFRDQLFAKVIEPDMVKKTEVAMTKVVSQYLRDNKASKEDIAKKMADIRLEFESQKDIPLGRQIQGTGFTIIFMFVLSVIFAAFFKRDPPNLPQAQ